MLPQLPLMVPPLALPQLLAKALLLPLLAGTKLFRSTWQRYQRLHIGLSGSSDADRLQVEECTPRCEAASQLQQSLSTRPLSTPEWHL